MDIDDFMDISKPIKKLVVPGSSHNAYEPYEAKDFMKIDKREKKGIKYAGKLKEEQEERMRETFNQVVRPSTSTLEDLDDEEFDVPAWFHANKTESMQEIYKKFKFNSRTPPSNLPVYRRERDIMMAVHRNPVVVIKGETGCGKSTQVPQMILDDAFRRDAYCNIMVTQPRRIAAHSLAVHVAQSRQCGLGTLVGYQVGLEKDVTDDTRLLYCTTGVALQKLVQMKNMSSYTHIILDEGKTKHHNIHNLTHNLKLNYIINQFDPKLDFS